MAQMRTSVVMQKQVLELHAKGMSIRGISKVLRKSRKTIRKIVEQAAMPVVQPSPDWVVAVDWQKVREEVGRGVSLSVLRQEYVGPEISYIKFWRYFKEKFPEDIAVSMRLKHQPGEKLFFDFTDGINVVDPATGKSRKTQLLVGVMAFSSMTWAEFVWDQKQPTLLRSLERAFHFLGGVTPYITIDNMKTGVTKAHRYDPDVNPTFVDFANHWGFAVMPARPVHPRDKAKNESGIGVIQRQFYNEVRNKTFYSLTELNQWLREYVDRLNNEVMKDYGVSRLERYETEKSLLSPLAAESFELCEWKSAKVHSDCHIQVERKFYSVPFRYVGRTVRVRMTAKMIEIFDEDQEPLASHVRLLGTEIFSTNEAHYPEHKVSVANFDIKQAKNIAGQVGPETVKLIEELFNHPYPLKFLRRAQGILRLYQTKSVSRDGLEYASRMGLLYKKTRYEYIKSTALYFDANGNRPVKAAPIRSSQEIHLHNHYQTKEE